MKAACSSMTDLVRRYLDHRRGFGYRLYADGYFLAAFARFSDRIAPGQPVTTRLAIQWASRQPAQPITAAHRLSAIRGFARFCFLLDPRTQIPPNNLIHCRNQRRAPHIFTDAQLRLILRRTQHLRPYRNPLRALVYRTLIRLLFCTGLRPSEALRLRDEHFDAATSTLRVPPVKRSPGRTLPVPPSTVRALQRYQKVRRDHFPLTRHFFIGPFGQPLQIGAADWTFRCLVRGIASNGSRPNLRLYDLRHHFASKLIARWSRQSIPLSHHLVLLSRYLGHKHFHDTYWYVQPELSALRTAAARFEQYRKQPNSERSV